MSHGDWNVTIPIDHTKVGDLPVEIRDVKSSAKVIFSKEHIPPGTSGSGGQHLKGAAVVYIDSVLPTTDPEGNNLDTSATSDNGRLAVATGQSNTLKVYAATSAGVSTGWQPVRAERMKLEETGDANGNVIKGLADGTQSGHAIHVGALDAYHLRLLQPSTSGKIGLVLKSQYMESSVNGLTIKALSIDSAAVSSGGGITCTPRTITSEEYCNFPNGLILKMGVTTPILTGATLDVGYPGNAFPDADPIISMSVSIKETGVAANEGVTIKPKAGSEKTHCQITNRSGVTQTCYWQVWGH